MRKGLLRASTGILLGIVGASGSQLVACSQGNESSSDLHQRQNNGIRSLPRILTFEEWLARTGTKLTPEQQRRYDKGEALFGLVPDAQLPIVFRHAQNTRQVTPEMQNQMLKGQLDYRLNFKRWLNAGLFDPDDAEQAAFAAAYLRNLRSQRHSVEDMTDPDSGSGADGTTDEACVPTTCAAQGACGTISDGCGGTLDCGPCPEACTPGTCGGACGTVSDGCGGTLNCGPCPEACTPATCGSACGTISDGCGGTLNCGDCPDACTPATCGGACGTISDGCGGTLNCGPCPEACTPATCGSACGTISDGCGGTLNCGDCPDACTPATCASANVSCGFLADGCGNTIDCGPCDDSGTPPDSGTGPGDDSGLEGDDSGGSSSSSSGGGSSSGSSASSSGSSSGADSGPPPTCTMTITLNGSLVNNPANGTGYTTSTSYAPNCNSSRTVSGVTGGGPLSEHGTWGAPTNASTSCGGWVMAQGGTDFFGHYYQGTCHETDTSSFSANSTVTFTASVSSVGQCQGATATVNGAAQSIITAYLDVKIYTHVYSNSFLNVSGSGTLQDWKAYASGQVTANANGITVTDTGNMQVGSNCTNSVSVGGGFSGTTPTASVGWTGACNTGTNVYLDTTTSQAMSANNTILSPATFTCSGGGNGTSSSCGGTLIASTISNKMNTDVISAVPAQTLDNNKGINAQADAYESSACILGKLITGSASVTVCPTGVTCSASASTSGGSYTTGGSTVCSF